MIRATTSPEMAIGQLSVFNFFFWISVPHLYAICHFDKGFQNKFITSKCIYTYDHWSLFAINSDPVAL